MIALRFVVVILIVDVDYDPSLVAIPVTVAVVGFEHWSFTIGGHFGDSFGEWKGLLCMLLKVIV